MQAMLLDGRQAMQRRLEAERERVVSQMRMELKSAEARMQAENAAVASKLERTEEKVAAIYAEKEEVRSLTRLILILTLGAEPKLNLTSSQRFSAPPTRRPSPPSDPYLSLL
jgi:hypothetical protein